MKKIALFMVPFILQEKNIFLTMILLGTTYKA
jgi:hypothetical protein